MGVTDRLQHRAATAKKEATFPSRMRTMGPIAILILGLAGCSLGATTPRNDHSEVLPLAEVEVGTFELEEGIKESDTNVQGTVYLAGGHLEIRDFVYGGQYASYIEVKFQGQRSDGSMVDLKFRVGEDSDDLEDSLDDPIEEESTVLLQTDHPKDLVKVLVVLAKDDKPMSSAELTFPTTTTTTTTTTTKKPTTAKKVTTARPQPKTTQKLPETTPKTSGSSHTLPGISCLTVAVISLGLM